MIQFVIFVCIGVLSRLTVASPISPDDAGISPRQSILGLVNLDSVASDCSFTNADIIRRAFRDLPLLTDAVQGISGADEYFQQFFGVGWNGGKYDTYFSYIAGNLDLAKQASLDRTQGGKVFVTCKDSRGDCAARPVSAYMTIPRSEGETQSMVICPRVFENEKLFHLTDKAKSGTATNLRSLVSYEHIILHELMHFDYAGYHTAFDSTDKFTSFNKDHSTYHLAEFFINYSASG
jgi:hypothetical protein